MSDRLTRPATLFSKQKPSLCSGCFHHFCFSCITKWANVSNNCPVCRKEYKNILHNFNTSVRVVRLGDERSGRKKQKREQPQDAQPEADGETDVKPSLKRDPFYIFETNAQQMIGLPIIDDEQVTNNIVQLNMNSVNQIPEIDIVNMTKNESGGRIITRHNYQLASGDQQELINELLSSAINRSVEEHQETISQVGPNASEEQAKSILNQNKGLTRLIDVYTLDRTRRQPRGRGRGGRFAVRSRYNLRPIEGVARVNPQVNRARLFEWQL